MELGRWRYKGKDKTLFDKEAELSSANDNEFCWADFGHGKKILMLRSSFHDKQTIRKSKG